MKKLIAVLLTVLMLSVLLAACGEEQTKETEPAPAQVTIPTDAQGEMIYPTDAEGWPVYPTDAQGEPVFATDAAGHDLIASDANGDPITENRSDSGNTPAPATAAPADATAAADAPTSPAPSDGTTPGGETIPDEEIEGEIPTVYFEFPTGDDGGMYELPML